MNDILSQEEIDKLLESVSTEGLNTENVAMGSDNRMSNVKIYDFRRPDKFSKEQIRTIQMMHETYARLTTTTLSAQLRSFVNIHVTSVDQLSYEEFARSIPNPSTLAIVNMDPLKGSAIIEIDPSITFTIIDRLFGGSGDILKENRELTDIELSVIETVIVRILGNLREAWSSVIDLKPKFSNIETNIQFAQIVPPNDMIVLISLDIKIGNISGLMNFCIPYITIESINNRLSAQFWYSNMAKNILNENLDQIKKHLIGIPISLVVELGRTELSIRTLLDIKEGDVITLDQKIEQTLKVYLENKLQYMCDVGVVGKNKLGIIIKEIIKEKE